MFSQLNLFKMSYFFRSLLPLCQLFETCSRLTEINSFSGLMCKICPFKYVLCSLCSIVNKILAQVIWMSFSFYFIQILKTSQHFWNLGCYTVLVLILNIHYKSVVNDKYTFILWHIWDKFKIQIKNKPPQKCVFISYIYFTLGSSYFALSVNTL